MGRIHEAIRRAEQEGRAGLVVPPGTREAAQGAIGNTGIPLRSAIRDLARPENENRPAVPAVVNDLSGLVEEKTVPDSRLVALSGKTYDELSHRLSRLRTGAAATDKNGLKTILVTSAGSGDGKSLTAANVSIALARESGERVLLVDANLRKPSLHRLLGISQGKGLSDLLRGEASANEFIFKTDISNLHAVKAGTMAGNPSELLNTRRMCDFLAFARKHFDWVFLDSPAMVPEPDAELLSSFVDGVLVVAGIFHAPIGSTLEAVRLLRGRRVLGIVCNGVQAPVNLLDVSSEQKGPLGALRRLNPFNRVS